MDNLQEIRQAVADYMRSEGCSCCQNISDHRKHKERLAKLLKVPKYDDDSGYDFDKFKSKED
jgi:methionine aminopeptidase